MEVAAAGIMYIANVSHRPAIGIARIPHAALMTWHDVFISSQERRCAAGGGEGALRCQIAQAGAPAAPVGVAFESKRRGRPL